jgi:hypothetical protein
MVLRQVRDPEQKLSRGVGKTRARRALTHRSIEALRPEAMPYRIPDSKSSGLAIRVAPSGLMTWDLAFRIKGSKVFKRLSLGRFPGVGLDDPVPVPANSHGPRGAGSTSYNRNKRLRSRRHRA